MIGFRAEAVQHRFSVTAVGSGMIRKAVTVGTIGQSENEKFAQSREFVDVAEENQCYHLPCGSGKTLLYVLQTVAALAPKAC